MQSGVLERGDVVWIDMVDSVGHEMKKRRPVIVLSPSRYNRASGLCIVCPITSKQKGYSQEVAIPDDQPVSGVILSHQIRSVDWRSRNAEYVCSLPQLTLDVVDRVLPLLISTEV